MWYWLLINGDELLKNLALLYTVASLLLRFRRVRQAFAVNNARGFPYRLLVFAALTALTMAFPLPLTSLVIDLRLSVLMLAALYLGPLGSMLLAALAAAVRYLMGGPGWSLAIAGLFYGPITYLITRRIHRRLPALLAATALNLAVFTVVLACLTRFYHPFPEISPWTNPATLLVLLAELTVLAPPAMLMLDAVIRQHIHDYRHRHDLEQQAHTDVMTGLCNHRRLQEILDRLLPRASADQPCSFLMLDVDYFKHYNDTFGHPQGDALLRRLAAVCRRQVRPGDFVARYGGEEFAIVLPNTGRKAAVQVAERIRTAVARLSPRDARLPGGGISISIGVATFPFDAADKENLLAAADEALYMAKNISRNRVEVYVPLFAPWQGVLTADDLDALMEGRAILAAANSRDGFIYGHSLRVMRLCDIIADRVALAGRNRDLLHTAAFLHDLGRVRLTQTATTVVWDDPAAVHAQLGAHWLQRLHGLPELADVVRRHHARCDEPDTTAGNTMETPAAQQTAAASSADGHRTITWAERIVLSRIVAVADTYDLLNHNKIPAPADNVLQSLGMLRGKTLDPAITAALLAELAAAQ